jgi:hypothetical protein
METLLTESMISDFSSSLLQGSSSGSVLLKLRGNFRQNGTQLELIEYHAPTDGSLFRSPRIDHWRRQIIEMCHVSRRQCGMASQDNTRNHGVAILAWTALHFSGSH